MKNFQITDEKIVIVIVAPLYSLTRGYHYGIVIFPEITTPADGLSQPIRFFRFLNYYKERGRSNENFHFL